MENCFYLFEVLFSLIDILRQSLKRCIFPDNSVVEGLNVMLTCTALFFTTQFIIFYFSTLCPCWEEFISVLDPEVQKTFMRTELIDASKFGDDQCSLNYV